MRYVHTNIIASDWRKLAAFYQTVFACTPVPPERSLSGTWLEEGTNVKNAALQGIHLRLPGHGDSGPTLEIFQYETSEEKNLPPAANRLGYGHLAFLVDDIDSVLESVLANGGKALGKVVQKEVENVGTLTFVYVCDPEDNIVEIQHWS